MVGSRWRSGASKDNDVKHEDHRYRIGLASGTKDIQLMIPYVTRRVFTRRLVILLARPSSPSLPTVPLAIGRPLGFTSATPKWTAGYPPRTVNIFSFDEGRPGRASSVDPGWPDPAITTLPGHAHHPAGTRGGYLRGVCYFFLPSTYEPYPASAAAGSQQPVPPRLSLRLLSSPPPPSVSRATH